MIEHLPTVQEALDYLVNTSTSTKTKQNKSLSSTELEGSKYLRDLFGST